MSAWNAERDAQSADEAAKDWVAKNVDMIPQASVIGDFAGLSLPSADSSGGGVAVQRVHCRAWAQPVAPALDVAAVGSADGDHRLDRIRGPQGARGRRDYADLDPIGAGQPASPRQSGRPNPGTVRLFLPALEEERSRTLRQGERRDRSTVDSAHSDLPAHRPALEEATPKRTAESQPASGRAWSSGQLLAFPGARICGPIPPGHPPDQHRLVLCGALT
jgi:hypothetical protein